MQRTFELFRHPIKGQTVLKGGFSWPGFLLTWIWALVHQLWFAGVFLLVINAVLALLAFVALGGNWVIPGVLSLVLQLTVGFMGNSWRSKSLEARGFEFVCAVKAGSAAAALEKVAQVQGDIPREWKSRPSTTALSFAPSRARALFAIVWLTLKAAFRYRLIQILVVLLLAAVVGLPAIIKDDGTAQGFTQILLTYTLGAITVLLGFATLWLACGTLARDVEECQIQVVVVKPVTRWEIWLGKWLGIMVLNLVLLGVSGAAVFGLMGWRAAQLPAAVQERLRTEILVARGSLREPIDTAAMDAEFKHDLQERLKDGNVAGMDRDFLEKQIRERVKAKFQIRPPGTGRRWTIDFGRLKDSLKGRILSVRFKFFVAQPTQSGTYGGVWEIGPPEGRRYSLEQPSLAPESFHEFPVSSEYIDDKGILTLDFFNYNNTALLFPLEDGLEVLYPESSFGLNFVRGLGIVACWLALLSTIGLAAGSFLSFPVAAFVSLAILVVGLSSGTIKQVVEEGGIAGINHDTGTVDNPDLLDRAAVPLFRGLLSVVTLVQDFSPLDSLSTGRSVTWGQLARALAQIVLLLGGVFAAIGIIAFTRRELAAAQGSH